MSQSTLKNKLHEIIFEADTKAGKLFDIALFVAIILSVIVVMLESVKSINAEYALQFDSLEWFFTILFTIEYITRIITSRTRYATSTTATALAATPSSRSTGRASVPSSRPRRNRRLQACPVSDPQSVLKIRPPKDSHPAKC